jgi:hypothetical protein
MNLRTTIEVSSITSEEGTEREVVEAEASEVVETTLEREDHMEIGGIPLREETDLVEKVVEEIVEKAEAEEEAWVRTKTVEISLATLEVAGASTETETTATETLVTETVTNSTTETEVTGTTLREEMSMVAGAEDNREDTMTTVPTATNNLKDSLGTIK